MGSFSCSPFSRAALVYGPKTPTHKRKYIKSIPTAVIEPLSGATTLLGATSNGGTQNLYFNSI